MVLSRNIGALLAIEDEWPMSQRCRWVPLAPWRLKVGFFVSSEGRPWERRLHFVMDQSNSYVFDTVLYFIRF